MKKFLQKNGLSLEEAVKFMSYNNTDYTLRCRQFTMYSMTALLATGVVGILNTLKILFIKVEVDSNVKSLVTLLELFLIAYPTGFYFLWGKDKYLAYFKRFEQEPKRKTRIWCFITIVLYMAILVLFFWSLRWLSI
jgi:hypothetical protein